MVTTWESVLVLLREIAHGCLLNRPRVSSKSPYAIFICETNLDALAVTIASCDILFFLIFFYSTLVLKGVFLFSLDFFLFHFGAEKGILDKFYQKKLLTVISSRDWRLICSDYYSNKILYLYHNSFIAVLSYVFGSF